MAKDLLGHAAGQEAAALLVPRAKDLVVPLLFFRREFPRDRDARLTELSLVVLLKLLLQRELLLLRRRLEARPLRRQLLLLLLLGGKLHLAWLHVRRRLDSLCGHEGIEELSLDACAEAARVESGRLRSQRLRWLLLLLEARIHRPLHRLLLLPCESGRLHLHRNLLLLLLWPLLLHSHKASRLRLQGGGQSHLAAVCTVTRVWMTGIGC